MGDCVISIDVFEHIPINHSDEMVDKLKKLQPKYMVIGISKDMISAGHITLKGTKWWEKKFLPEYRMMKELEGKFRKNQKDRKPRYQDTGMPRNGYNKCPGIMFFKKASGI